MSTVQIQNDIIIGKSGVRIVPTTLKCGGLFFSIAYGAKNIETPFEVGLTDFRLLKYPGSESPSSYESDITIKDELNKVLDMGSEKASTIAGPILKEVYKIVGFR